MTDDVQVWEREGYRISTDRDLLDLERIHRYLSEESYWAAGIRFDLVERAIAGSYCFGLYSGGGLAGFARVVTDGATFGYLADVFVLPEHTGKGLGGWLVECTQAHPELAGLRRWVLVTADAHDLYERFGFKPLANPERYMELHVPGVYLM